MADYPLKQEAAEVQEIISGAVLANKATNLSAAEMQRARDNIGATAYGEGIKIISHFGTLDELTAAVPNPGLGAAYSVGAAIPYNLYVFDSLFEIWRDYGPIRSSDISARFKQNIPVSVSDWVLDENVFVDYKHKAAIKIADISGRDVPIIAFSPSDAAGGNFCPVAFSFDGYAEIWAKTAPTSEITIASATYIIIDDERAESGSNTKGITNASGGIPTGGVTNSMLADNMITADKVSREARTQYFDVAVGTEWTGDAAPYSQTIAVEGLLEIDRAKVRFSPPESFLDLEARQEAFALLYDAESADGAITLYAKELPETAFAVVLEVARI